MSDLRAKCPCGHVFVVAHLPMPIEMAAKLAMRASCPKCGETKGLRIAPASNVDEASR